MAKLTLTYQFFAYKEFNFKERGDIPSLDEIIGNRLQIHYFYAKFLFPSSHKGVA